MADEQRVYQGGITVPSELVDQTELVMQGGITVPAELVNAATLVTQGGITVVACVIGMAPTGLTVTADANDLVLDWTIALGTEDGFRIEYSTDDITYNEIDTVATGIDTYTDTNRLVGETCATTFYYRVVAFAGICEETSASANYVLVAPDVPTDLTATFNDGNVVLTWTDNSAIESGFVVERSIDDITYTTITTLDPDTVTYTDTSVYGGQSYYYRVEVLQGGCGAYSDTDSVYVPASFLDPCPPVATYQLILYDPDGTQVAIIDDYRSLQFGHDVNNKGFFTLQLGYFDSKRTLFQHNSILEVKRKIPEYLGWYREFIGHCENFLPTFFSNGNTQFTVVGSGFNGLLGRVIIAYADGSNEAKKDTAAETAMKEYVRENRGDLATVANGRETTTQMTMFYVEGDLGSGNNWSGERGGKKLLEALQDIANVGDVDFNTVVHPTLGMGNYLFETYEDQMGEDRTTVGLDPATGLNASGNVPQIFSTLRGNVSVARVRQKHSIEINRIYIYGQDPVTGLSKIRYRENTTAIDGDTINIREAMRGGASQVTNAEMDALADEYLEENQYVEDYEFTPIDIPASIYGLHYKVGDRVTVQLGDLERNKRLVRASITVSGNNGGESNKDFEFKDIP